MTPIPDEGKSSGRVYYESRTEDGKLFTTLHIKRVVPNDDSVNGAYECKGNSSSGLVSDPWGVTITVIRNNEVPTAAVKGATINVGGSTNLTCNITNPLGILNQMRDLSWVKNSQVIQRKLYPDSIETITIKNAAVKDGGDYVCVGLVRFRGVLEKNITFGTATLKLKLKMDEGVTKVEASPSEIVTMECPADAYPINVTWWRVNKEGEATRLKMSQRYTAFRTCPSCRYVLQIIDLELHDSGKYACHVNSTIGSGKHLFQLSVIPAKESSTFFPTFVDNGTMSTIKPKANAIMYCAQSPLILLSYLVTKLLM